MSTAEWYTVFKLEKCTSSLLVTAHNFLQACFYFVYLWTDHVNLYATSDGIRTLYDLVL